MSATAGVPKVGMGPGSCMVQQWAHSTSWLPLPVVAVDQIKNHQVRGVDELALDRQELAVC